jgi:hypothetical protein
MMKNDVFRISFIVVFFAMLILANVPNIGFKWEGNPTGKTMPANDGAVNWMDYSYASSTVDSLNVFFWPAFYEKQLHQFNNDHQNFEYPPLLLMLENKGFESTMARANSPYYQPERVMQYYQIRLGLNFAYWLVFAFAVAKGIEYLNNQ